MRNAERYLAQGKIQSAIGEYKQVVANDPKDIGTLNMLGDLHTKNADKKQAVSCYTTVAEHYSKQGFAQKAIAVYNKISKIQPGSIEITAKLADLYKFKGSVNEARAHYKIVAEFYESEGKRIEALEVRKQIASLDPTDTAIHLDLAAAFLEEGQAADAAEAFTEAGIRLAKKGDHAKAIDAFGKALDITPLDPKVLAGFTQSHFANSTPADAVRRLEEIQSSEPHNGDVLSLLIDCYLEAGNTADAEKSLISLVEKEPAHYPKLVDLARIYLKAGDAESAARIVSMSSEHLLLAGQSEDLQSLLIEILALDAEQLEALRLSARLSGWLRDDAGMHSSLTLLASVARKRDSIEDERFALSQLVTIAPHEVEYADRLKEIQEEFGVDDAYAAGNLFDEQFMKAPKAADEPELETFEAQPVEIAEADQVATDDLAEYADFAIVEDAGFQSGEIDAEDSEPTEEDRLLREVDSIKFYIDSGYLELAEKAIGELRSEFGDCAEVNELKLHLESHRTTDSDEVAVEPQPVAETQSDSNFTNGSASPEPQEQPAAVSAGFGIDDLRSELGIDEVDATSDSDYETHYHTAVAYQEMGLLDEAIKEFQEAVGLVVPGDSTRRFFQCANLLGHCFMQKSMPNLALTWYQRALESPGLGDEEKQGIWYELALAYEADGDLDNAGRYFEQVYAENIDFRDVSERVKNIAVSQ